MPYCKAIDVWSVACIIGELFRALKSSGIEPSARVLFRGGASANSGERNAFGDQLDKIVDILGAPFEEPEFEALPRAAKRQLSFYSKQNGAGLRASIPGEVDEVGVDLLVKMLNFFPDKRLSVSDAIGHKFFAAVMRNSTDAPPMACSLQDFNFDQIETEDALRKQLQHEVDSLHAREGAK